MTAPAGADALGRGLRLDDGDLVLDGGRLAEVAGAANLSQALTLRILTPAGSDRFNTRYGLDLSRVFSEPSGVRMVKELIKLNVVSTLGTDPRVRDIRQITFDDDPERVAADPTGADTARRRRRWTVEVRLDTVVGSALTLRADVEVGRQ
jgi:phage baseplate assembly protein W